jgi:hypothetical protein
MTSAIDEAGALAALMSADANLRVVKSMPLAHEDRGMMLQVNLAATPAMAMMQHH